ncbi:hypothetical protein ACOMHN_001685 [Nucella lapillus]
MWTGGLCAHMEIEGPLGHIVPSCGLVVYVPIWRSKGNHCRTYRAIMWTGGLCAHMEIEGPLGHIVPSCGLVVYVPTWRSKGL